MIRPRAACRLSGRSTVRVVVGRVRLEQVVAAVLAGGVLTIRFARVSSASAGRTSGLRPPGQAAAAGTETVGPGWAPTVAEHRCRGGVRAW